jgi:hypothetical protein
MLCAIMNEMFPAHPGDRFTWLLFTMGFEDGRIQYEFLLGLQYKIQLFRIMLSNIIHTS